MAGNRPNAGTVGAIASRPGWRIRGLNVLGAEAERQSVRSARLTEAGKVRVTCPSCGSRLSVPESTPADTDVRCPKCQQVFPKPPGQIAK